jgi:hypothetical protein
MAKAVIKLSDALGDATESYGAAEGKRRILEKLKSGELRAFGFRKHSNESILIPVEFWQDKPVDDPIRSEAFGCRSYYQAHIDSLQGSAWREPDGVEAYYGIQLAGNDFVKLLPPDVVDGDDTLAKVWVPRVAQDLKRAGKLDQITKKIELARLIIAAGVEAGRDKVGESYVTDNLGKWELWPTSKIKI